MQRMTYTLDGEIATITMDDGKVNAIQREFLTEMNAALDQAESDRAKAILLTGRPDRFCAGLDLKTLPTLERDDLRDTLRLFGDTMVRLFLFPRPIVAAINGHAIAGGAVIALTADKRICTDGPYKIGLNEVAISIPLPSYVIDFAEMGLKREHWIDAIYHGVLYSPQDAREVGYADEVVGADELMPRARSIAQSLAMLPDLSYARTKERGRGRRVKASLATMDEETTGFMSAVGGN